MIAGRYHGGRRHRGQRFARLTPTLLMRLVAGYLCGERLDGVEAWVVEVVAAVAARTRELAPEDPAGAYDRAVAELAPEWSERSR